MAVAKRQRRRKPAKLEQRKVQGLEEAPQVKQAALLAGPVCRGQAWGGINNTEKEEPKSSHGLLFSSCVLG